MQHISVFLRGFDKSLQDREEIDHIIKEVFEKVGIQVKKEMIIGKENKINLKLTPTEKSVALENKDKLEKMLASILGEKKKITFLNNN